MAPIVINGRFPHHPGASFMGVKVSRVLCDHESVTIRLDHPVHPDFWMELSVHCDLLVQWYETIQSELLALAADDPVYQEYMSKMVGQLKEMFEKGGERRRIVYEGEEENGEGKPEGHAPSQG